MNMLLTTQMVLMNFKMCQGKKVILGSEITGIPADHIEKLASEMSTQQPVELELVLL